MGVGVIKLLRKVREPYAGCSVGVKIAAPICHTGPGLPTFGARDRWPRYRVRALLIKAL